jgi:hypothetical protein
VVQRAPRLDRCRRAHPLHEIGTCGAARSHCRNAGLKFQEPVRPRVPQDPVITPSYHCPVLRWTRPNFSASPSRGRPSVHRRPVVALRRSLALPTDVYSTKGALGIAVRICPFSHIQMSNDSTHSRRETLRSTCAQGRSGVTREP